MNFNNNIENESFKNFYYKYAQLIVMILIIFKF